MPTPTPTETREDASDAAFLVSGMDRDCLPSYLQDQPHEAPLDLLPPPEKGRRDGLGLGIAPENAPADGWGDFLFYYTVLMTMPVDLGDITRAAAEVDTISIEVSFDEAELSQRDSEAASQSDTK